MLRGLVGNYAWCLAKVWEDLLEDDRGSVRWICEFGTAKDMQELLERTKHRILPPYYFACAIRSRNIEMIRVLMNDGRVAVTGYAVNQALFQEDDDVLRLILPEPTWVLPYFTEETPARRRLYKYINDERIRQSLVLAWIGTELGQGWKDIMCDIVVKYIGALYETRIQ
jgi:hypothetical protein